MLRGMNVSRWAIDLKLAPADRRRLEDLVGSVQRIWRAHGLKPRRVRTFKLSRDPQFAEGVQDVVGLYMNPPQHALVVSVDEKSQISMSTNRSGSSSGRASNRPLNPVRRRAPSFLPRHAVTLEEPAHDTGQRRRVDLLQVGGEAMDRMAETGGQYDEERHRQSGMWLLVQIRAVRRRQAGRQCRVRHCQSRLVV